MFDPNHEPSTMDKLSNAINISHVSAPEQIAQLVRKGYLKKEATETRSIVVIRRPE